MDIKVLLIYAVTVWDSVTQSTQRSDTIGSQWMLTACIQISVYRFTVHVM